jgi:HAE1 family hydrophobic/amphiphilic exporter-1
MNITVSALRRPVTTLMIFISIVLIGAISLKLIPLEFFPDIDAPFIGVEIPYPNSTPEEIEREITRPAEEVLATITDLKEMSSFSQENSTFINLQFNWGVDIDAKSLEAREKLDGIRDQLPADIERFFIHKWSSADEEILELRLSSNRDLSNAYDMLNRNVKRRIERLDGVSRVTLYGVEQKEIRVQLQVDRLIAHHVDINHLVETLMQSNFSVTAGRITDGNKRFAVRPLGELRSVEDYKNLIIGQRNLRLSDVASITYEHPELDYGRHLDRTYAVGLDVFKEAGANTVEVSDRILEELAEIEKNPEMEGISIYHMDSQAEGIISSLNELFKSGLLGAILAISVLYFFLRRWATTLIVTLAVPFSLLVALACMYFLNLSLNILSMMGLMLAIGMLVDNAVVATESIHRHQQFELNTRKATINGVREIALAITAGTLTTIIVFLPQIVSSQDEMAIYLKHVSIALCISLVASLIIAQTVVPLFAARLKYIPKEEKKTAVSKLLDYYSALLKWTLNHRKWTVGFLLLILFSIAVPASFVKFDMFPEQQRDRKLRLHYNVNDTYTLAEVEKAVDIIEEYLFKHKQEFEIRSVYSYYQTNYALSTILLTKNNSSQKPQTEIQDLIRQNLPKIAIGDPAFERRNTDGRESGIRIQLIGKSSEELSKLSKDVAWTLSKIEGLFDVRSEAEAGKREVHVVVDRKRNKKYGFTTREVANVVSAALRGIRLRKFRNHEGEVNVRIEFQDVDKRNLEHLYNLPLLNQNNQLFRLISLADFRLANGPPIIRRDNRITGIGVSANLQNITVNEARKKINEVLSQYQFPPGYSWNYGQRFSYEDEAAKNMLINMILAVALIYFVMASLFESLVFPAGIWSSIIFAVVGVYWFFMFTATTMSVMGMIGILILIGVVVNNGIVLVDHIIQLRNQGIARDAAILQAGRDRLRPILMTAATTIFSLLPLTMVTTQIGGNGPPYYPMARAIVGGLSFSTFVTLLILPTIYILLDNLRNWSKRVISSAVK